MIGGSVVHPGQRKGLFWEVRQQGLCGASRTAQAPPPPFIHIRVPTVCDVEHAAHVHRYVEA